ncbi:DNA polymerase III subunit delta [bacterium]|nr:DNA polymerase III subunit delta [bacterium]
MAASRSALDIIAQPDGFDIGNPSLIMLVGDEPFLSFHMRALLRERLCPDEADRAWAWREFAGNDELDPRDVFDEAATVPLFAGATRAAIVREADAFVTKARAALETFAAGPRGRRGLVILEVMSLPANTRLAKAVAQHGLSIDVTIPGRTNLAAWVRRWAGDRHGVTLAAATAERLLERLGGNLGHVDQAIARLAAALGPGEGKRAIPPEAIEDMMGSPQERTAWGMIDAAALGDARTALAQLADLLDAGESPIGITAQAAAVFRRLSAAARLLALPADGGRPVSIGAALQEAGVGSWPKAVALAREALGQLGGRRARQLPGWLLDLDTALKGDASRGLRARLALERLFCKMARPPAAPRPQGSRS